MSNDIGYGPGSIPHSHFQVGFVAASYFASLCGCLLTIEMLHRRGTALGNLRSWYVRVQQVPTSKSADIDQPGWRHSAALHQWA